MSAPIASAVSNRFATRSIAITLAAAAERRNHCTAAGNKRPKVIVGAHPWVYAATLPGYDITPKLESIFADMAYADGPLPIGNGQTISQPFIVALMTDVLDLDAGSRVLEIGTGCGYQTAVLAPLVRRVYTVERIKTLLEQARRRFQALRIRNIVTKHTDGTIGLPEYGPFDGIIVTAAPEGIPLALVEQLRPGGCMVKVSRQSSIRKTILTRTQFERAGAARPTPGRAASVFDESGGLVIWRSGDLAIWRLGTRIAQHRAGPFRVVVRDAPHDARHAPGALFVPAGGLRAAQPGARRRRRCAIEPKPWRRRAGRSSRRCPGSAPGRAAPSGWAR